MENYEDYRDDEETNERVIKRETYLNPSSNERSQRDYEEYDASSGNRRFDEDDDTTIHKTPRNQNRFKYKPNLSRNFVSTKYSSKTEYKNGNISEPYKKVKKNYYNGNYPKSGEKK